mmetsp:Transcript_16393/g.40321  ORF Transcript_16393/g.40321 Transcript_16393/m.40321 type:complete len:384 (+) Transcript_16393:819-1970(+)
MGKESSMRLGPSTKRSSKRPLAHRTHAASPRGRSDTSDACSSRTSANRAAASRPGALMVSATYPGSRKYALVRRGASSNMARKTSRAHRVACAKVCGKLPSTHEGGSQSGGSRGPTDHGTDTCGTATYTLARSPSTPASSSAHLCRTEALSAARRSERLSTAQQMASTPSRRCSGYRAIVWKEAGTAAEAGPRPNHAMCALHVVNSSPLPSPPEPPSLPLPPPPPPLLVKAPPLPCTLPPPLLGPPPPIEPPPLVPLPPRPVCMSSPSSSPPRALLRFPAAATTAATAAEALSVPTSPGRRSPPRAKSCSFTSAPSITHTLPLPPPLPPHPPAPMRAQHRSTSRPTPPAPARIKRNSATAPTVVAPRSARTPASPGAATTATF